MQMALTEMKPVLAYRQTQTDTTCLIYINFFKVTFIKTLKTEREKHLGIIK